MGGEFNNSKFKKERYISFLIPDEDIIYFKKKGSKELVLDRRDRDRIKWQGVTKI
jgi:hypothetical protein